MSIESHTIIFWDNKKKRFTDFGPDNSLLCLTSDGAIGTITGYKVQPESRYYALRVAQHAPKMENPVTGEMRQLMEGDVIEYIPSSVKSIVVFLGDTLVMFCECDKSTATLSCVGGLGSRHRDLTEDHRLLGNALPNPGLVAKWDTLPEWDLLKSVVDRWKADDMLQRSTAAIAKYVHLAAGGIAETDNAINSINDILAELEDRQ